MVERIEGEAVVESGGGIAEPISHPGMGELVDGDGDGDGEDPDKK